MTVESTADVAIKVFVVGILIAIAFAWIFGIIDRRGRP